MVYDYVPWSCNFFNDNIESIDANSEDIAVINDIQDGEDIANPNNPVII